MIDWPLFAAGVAVGSILTAAALFYSVEIRLRRLRLQMELELEELKRCVARAKAGPDRWKITTPDGKE